MDSLLPNLAVLKHPSNWFLVAFAAIILAFVAHLLCRSN